MLRSWKSASLLTTKWKTLVGLGVRPFSAAAATLTPEQKKAAALANFPKPRIIPKKTQRNKHNPRPYLKKAHPWLFLGRSPKPRLGERHPWSLSPEEYRAIKNDKRNIKVPLDQRLPSPKYLMSQLKWEEVEKTKVQYPRDVQPFVAGDRLKITKYISLGRENKFEVVKGMCIGIVNRSVDSNFKILNHRDGLSWEMTIPLWSPFIKKIEVTQKSNYTHMKKIYFMRKRPWEEFITK